MADPNAGFLAHAHRLLLYFGGFYASVLVLLAVPSVQRHAIYLHAIRIPFGAQLDKPHLYGLAPHRALDVGLTTADGLRLGAWFVLADAAYTLPPRALDDAAVRGAVQAHPTIIFFHGNAGTRAAVFRPRAYGMYTSRLRANVLAVDYRGFADSQGVPSEQGLLTDARAAWDWLVERGARPADIVLMGQSLGTGVVAGLAAQLADEGVDPRGVVMIASFQSFPLMLEEYQMFGFVPLLAPLKAIPFITKLLFMLLETHFDSATALPRVRASITLVHALDDSDIPHTQSIALFHTLLESRLTPIPPELSPALGIGLSSEQVRQLHRLADTRKKERELAVHKHDAVFASVQRFERPGNFGNVSLLLPVSGRHNEVLLSEGVVDFVGVTLDIDRSIPSSPSS